MDRYYWRDENVPDGYDHAVSPDYCVYDRNFRSIPIATCYDPDVAQRIVDGLNFFETVGRVDGAAYHLNNIFAVKQA